MDLLAIHLFNERRALRRERLFRDRLNPLEVYDYVEVRRLFRFHRENVFRIVDRLKDKLAYSTGRGHCLPPVIQVCIALRYYATGKLCMRI
jgi:nuclease HARBI1